VKLNLKQVVPAVIVGLVVFVGIAEWLLFLMPAPHGRLTYMVAGTASTVAALGAIFARLVRKRDLWISPPRGERGSTKITSCIVPGSELPS
jgi:hypothetical protein